MQPSVQLDVVERWVRVVGSHAADQVRDGKDSVRDGLELVVPEAVRREVIGTDSQGQGHDGEQGEPAFGYPGHFAVTDGLLVAVTRPALAERPVSPIPGRAASRFGDRSAWDRYVSRPRISRR